MECRFELKIPQERIAVVIGKNGETKKELETEAKCNIEVNSKEGDIIITGEDAVTLYSLKEVITAIGRGFSPETAQQLFKQDYVLEVIALNDFLKNKNQMARIKGRVIGANGRARVTLEELTETNITVYGKTISIIGQIEKVALSKRAVESLLAGSLHRTVYKWLEKQRRMMRMATLNQEWQSREEEK